jgi:hypothetical protein
VQLLFTNVNAPSSDAEKFNSGAQLMQIMTLCLIKKKTDKNQPGKTDFFL